MNQEMTTGDKFTPLTEGAQIEVTRGKKKRMIAQLMAGKKPDTPMEWQLSKGLSKKDQARFGEMLKKKEEGAT